MAKAEEQKNVETPLILKGGVEKTVGKKLKNGNKEKTEI